jgi:hypothetical protein
MDIKTSGIEDVRQQLIRNRRILIRNHGDSLVAVRGQESGSRRLMII